LPVPNLVVVNPSNGHAHLIYLLGAWVQTDFGDSRRLKVVRYAAAIERAYTAALGADTAYAGRFHHNPLSCAYVTKIGREAPYSLDELARYVDLTAPPQKKIPPTGIGRNVEIFDRLRRWAYVAVADWRIGTYDAWCGAVADRGEQIATDVGAESPRGPLAANEVGHIVKSVARWVWERYGADVPPLLREARMAAQREREKARQTAREATRERSRMTRAEYEAPARQRRAEALEMRGNGIAAREIARVLSVSVREVYRLLRSVVTSVVRVVQSASKTTVQGPPALSDFKGPRGSFSLLLGDVGIGRVNSADMTVNDDVVISEPFTAHGGAIAAAIVSEYAVAARSAELNSDATSDGRGVWGETNVGESPIAYIQRRICEIVAKQREQERPP
jgi:DNA-binding CsgD family transcriptional regulator